MLRLVCCDVDGTLLPATHTALSRETLDVLRRLTDKGVTVVIASGRPYAQLRELLEGISHRLIFICLDGAVTWHRHCVLHKRPLLRRPAEALIRRFPGTVVHGREQVYRPDGGTLNTIGEPFLKLELPVGSFDETADWYRVAYRGGGVTELVAPCAHKGNAIRTVMEKFGVTPDQAVAFGDGENDAELLAAVGHPYLMQPAGVSLELPGLRRTRSVPDTLKELFNLA